MAEPEQRCDWIPGGLAADRADDVAILAVRRTPQRNSDHARSVVGNNDVE